jgi:hypothetical protein
MADPIGQPNIDPTGQKKSPADYIDTNKIAQALNVNMEGVPGAPKISDIQSRVKDRGTAATELGTLEDQQQRLRQSIGQLESSSAYGKSIGESGVKQFAADSANNIRMGQERIKAENPLPKFIPTQENVQSLSTLFSLLGVISIGGGSKNKLSAMGALNSMTGMMKGWREGRSDLWKQETIKFEKDMAQIKANLDAAAKEADLALKMLPYDVQKAEAMVQELVAKTGSQILKQKADLQGVQEAVKFVKELQTGFEKQFDENLKTRAANLADTRESRESENQKQLRANEAERLKLEKERVGFERERVQIEKQKLSSRIDDVGKELNSMGVYIADKKDRAAVQESVGAMAELKGLQKEVTNNPNLVGRQGQIAQFTDRYLKSFKGGESFDESKVSQADQEALLFAKKYASMLTRYERALAGSGRSGSTVSFQNRYNSLLSQNQFNAASMSQLFDDMQKEAASVAMTKSNNLTYPMLDDMANRFNTRLSEPTSSTVSSSARQTAPESAIKYLKEHPEVKEQFKNKYGYLPEGV